MGKSTFLSLLIGDLEASDGEVVRNRFLRVGKYSQHFVDVLPMDKSAVEYLQANFPDLGYQAARALLGGSPEAAIESLLTRMQGDRAFATRAGREDLLQAFALLPPGDDRVLGWRRRLAALLN